MKYQATLETVITVTKYGVVPISSWPLPVGSSRSVVLQHNIRYWITIVNLIFSCGGSLYTIYEHRHDFVRAIKIASEMIAMTAGCLKAVICKMQASRFQGFIANMETFLEQATQKEKELLQGYVNKFSLAYGIVLVSVVGGGMTFIAGPWLSSQPFPADIIYPFPTGSTWVWAVLFTSHSMCIIQVICSVIADFMIAILLWYAGARFRMLSLALREATDADEVNRCIQQHQAFIESVEEFTIALRIITVQVTICDMIAVITGGFILLGDQELYDWAKYFFFVLTTAMELFVIAWPADHLIEVSDSVANAAYDCHWIGKSPGMRKNIIFIIQRSRNPMIIAVNGLLPVLSLEFYGSTMAATFSYLTTLRAMIADQR